MNNINDDFNENKDDCLTPNEKWNRIIKLYDTYIDNIGFVYTLEQ